MDLYFCLVLSHKSYMPYAEGAVCWSALCFVSTRLFWLLTLPFFLSHSSQATGCHLATRNGSFFFSIQTRSGLNYTQIVSFRAENKNPDPPNTKHEYWPTLWRTGLCKKNALFLRTKIAPVACWEDLLIPSSLKTAQLLTVHSVSELNRWVQP